VFLVRVFHHVCVFVWLCMCVCVCGVCMSRIARRRDSITISSSFYYYLYKWVFCCAITCYDMLLLPNGACVFVFLCV